MKKCQDLKSKTCCKRQTLTNIKRIKWLDTEVLLSSKALHGEMLAQHSGKYAKRFYISICSSNNDPKIGVKAQKYVLQWSLLENTSVALINVEVG